jgi:hypothetical protein
MRTVIMSVYAPIITKRVKGKPAPWLSVELKKLMNNDWSGTIRKSRAHFFPPPLNFSFPYAHEYGVYGKELDWFKDYLFQRMVRVAYNSNLSQESYPSLACHRVQHSARYYS